MNTYSVNMNPKISKERTPTALNYDLKQSINTSALLINGVFMTLLNKPLECRLDTGSVSVRPTVLSSLLKYRDTYSGVELKPTLCIKCKILGV